MFFASGLTAGRGAESLALHAAESRLRRGRGRVSVAGKHLMTRMRHSFAGRGCVSPGNAVCMPSGWGRKFPELSNDSAAGICVVWRSLAAAGRNSLPPPLKRRCSGAGSDWRRACRRKLFEKNARVAKAGHAPRRGTFSFVRGMFLPLVRRAASTRAASPVQQGTVICRTRMSWIWRVRNICASFST